MKVYSRKLVAQNLLFNIFFDHVQDDFGNEVKEYLVVSPKNSEPNMVTGCAILPIFNNQVGLIYIERPAIRNFSWEIPHGFIDPGETQESSAQRELLEETGLKVDISQFISLGYITPDSGVLAGRVQLFAAEGKSFSVPTVSELGLTKFKFFDFSEFERMILCSEIQDTFTIAAWFKYRQFKGVAAF